MEKKHDEGLDDRGEGGVKKRMEERETKREEKKRANKKVRKGKTESGERRTDG